MPTNLGDGMCRTVLVLDRMSLPLGRLAATRLAPYLRDTMKLIGIDGCRGGWVCATAPPDLATVTFTIETDLTAVFSAAVRDGDLVVVDIPIGLASREPRGCDLAARQYLQGPRKSSVFPAPCQATTAATTYEEACELNRRA